MSKTNFAFEMQYAGRPAEAGASGEERSTTLARLENSLRTLLAAYDSTATVSISRSHKGNNNSILELTSSATDAQVSAVLQEFCKQHAVTVNALE